MLPDPARWTVDQFHRVKESGVWEGRKILLIDGELVGMPAPKPPHDIALLLADYLFKALFGPGYAVRTQMGLVLNINTDPVPDLAVAPGGPRSQVITPGTAVFVLEVSDGSFAYDANEKASLYAAAGIADYWVVDIAGGRVLVHRSPVPGPKAKYGVGYGAVTVLRPGQSLAPLAQPHTPVAAADLLP